MANVKQDAKTIKLINVYLFHKPDVHYDFAEENRIFQRYSITPAAPREQNLWRRMVELRILRRREILQMLKIHLKQNKALLNDKEKDSQDVLKWMLAVEAKRLHNQQNALPPTPKGSKGSSDMSIGQRISSALKLSGSQTNLGVSWNSMLTALFKMPLEDYSTWVLNKMKTHSENIAILELGAFILLECDRAEGWSKNIATVPPDTVDWALTYSGPFWDCIYVFLFNCFLSRDVSMRTKAQTDTFRKLIQATIKNLSNLKRLELIKSVEQGDGEHIETKKKPEDEVVDDIWPHLLSSQLTTNFALDLSFKWNSDQGLSCLTWAFIQYQHEPTANPILCIFDIFRNIMLLAISGKNKNMAAQYLSSEPFMTAVKRFLPTLFGNLHHLKCSYEDSEDTERVQRIRMYVVFEIIYVLSNLKDVPDFVRKCGQMDFPGAFLEALELTKISPEFWKVKWEGQSLDLRLILLIFSFLAQINNDEYTEEYLQLMKLHLIRCKYKKFQHFSEEEVLQWGRAGPHELEKYLKLHEGPKCSCLSQSEKEKRAALKICRTVRKTLQKYTKLRDSIDKQGVAVLVETKTSLPAETKSVPDVQQKSVPAAQRKTVPAVPKKTITPAQKKVVPPVQPKAVPPVQQKPVSAVQPKPFTPVPQKSILSVPQKPLPPATQKPAPPVQQKPVAPVPQKPVPPVQKKSAQNVPVIQEKTSISYPLDKKSFVYTEKKSTPYVSKASNSSVQQGSSAEKKSSAASDKKAVPAVEQKGATPVKKQGSQSLKPSDSTKK